MIECYPWRYQNVHRQSITLWLDPWPLIYYSFHRLSRNSYLLQLAWLDCCILCYFLGCICIGCYWFCWRCRGDSRCRGWRVGCGTVRGRMSGRGSRRGSRGDVFPVVSRGWALLRVGVCVEQINILHVLININTLTSRVWAWVCHHYRLRYFLLLTSIRGDSWQHSSVLNYVGWTLINHLIRDMW